MPTQMPTSTEVKERIRESIIAPIAFMITWSIALSNYPDFDSMKTYAIIDLTFCCFLILFTRKLPPWFGYIRIVYLVTMFALGWVWFTSFTGYSIFTMAGELGTGHWLTYPLLIQVVYFQLWLYVAVAGLFATFLLIVLGIAMISCCL